MKVRGFGIVKIVGCHLARAHAPIAAPPGNGVEFAGDGCQRLRARCPQWPIDHLDID
jgi:hypothetical protein